MIDVRMQRQEAEELVELLLTVRRNHFQEQALETLVYGLGMVSTPEQYGAWRRDHDQSERLEGA